MPKLKIIFSIAFLLIAAHFIFIMFFFEPAISTPDANGYLAQARLLAQENRSWFSTDSPLQYIGMHWLKTDDGRYFSRYPPGLPLLQAVFYKLSGPTGALLLNPLLASLSLLGLFLVCRLWIGSTWAFAALTALAVNPVFNNYALAEDSHAAVACFLIWGLYFLARWSIQFSPVFGFLTGLFWGYIPAIRYPEAVFIIGVCLYVWMYRIQNKQPLRSIIPVISGLTLPMVLLVIRNYHAFGGFLTTGYALTYEQSGFGWKYFTVNAVPYLLTLMGQGIGLFAAIGLLGIVILISQRSTRPQGILFCFLIIPTTIIYMAYYFSAGNMELGSMRFLLPTFYIYVTAGMWGLKIIAENRRNAAFAAAGFILFITVSWGIPQSVQYLNRLKSMNTGLSAVTDSVKQYVEPGSVIIAGNQILQHLDFIGQWKLADESIIQNQGRLPPQDNTGDDNEQPRPMQMTKLEDKLTTIERYKPTGTSRLSEILLNDLNEWAEPLRRIYWIGSFEAMEYFVPKADILKPLAKIKLPEMPGRNSGGIRRTPGAMRQRFAGRNAPSGGLMTPPMMRRMRPVQGLIRDNTVYLVEWVRFTP